MTKTEKAPADAPILRRTDRYTSTYSNNVQLQVSAFDVRMTFGEMSNEPDGLAIDQKVSIVMSLHHAKAFSEILSQNISEYEKQIGELKLPARGDSPASETSPAVERTSKSKKLQ